MSEQDYIFLSYSHSDSIEKYVEIIESAGYKTVFDETISFGEEWDLKVRRQISNPKCKGVLVFLSNKAAASGSILKEVEYTIKYRKPYVAVMLSDSSPSVVFDSVSRNGTDKEKFVTESLSEYFPEVQIYVKADDINFDNNAKLKKTFSEWGLSPNADILNDFCASTYTSNIMGEKERLELQATGYLDFDTEAIDLALNQIGGGNLCVLDLGCSDGYVTYSRFLNHPKITKVIGLDYNEKDIALAKEKYKDDERFKFYCVNLESPQIIDDVKAILKENNLTSVDIVFCAFIMQHLSKPKILLLKLFDILSSNGKVIIRESDDGCKIGYPHAEMLDEIMRRSNKLIKSSDRYFGRKLYTYLNELGYENIRVLYSIKDTIGKSRKEKEWLFTMGFSFRLNRIKSIINENPANVFLQKEFAWLEESTEKLKEAFCSRDYYYSVRTFIAVASV